MSFEKIAAVIAKLIAKADSTTHDAEAEVFMAKAHDMMRQHGLSLLDLGRLDTEDPVGHDRDALHSFDSETWVKLVYASLARYYGCELVHGKNGVDRYKTLYTVFGRESARVTFMLMAPFVARQVRQAAVAGVKDGKFATKSKAMTAIGNALAIRITRLIPTVAPVEGKGLNALVPVDLIQAEIESVFSNVKYSKGRNVKFSAAARDAASRISINHQTPAASTAAQIGA